MNITIIVRTVSHGRPSAEAGTYSCSLAAQALRDYTRLVEKNPALAASSYLVVVNADEAQHYRWIRHSECHDQAFYSCLEPIAVAFDHVEECIVIGPCGLDSCPCDRRPYPETWTFTVVDPAIRTDHVNGDASIDQEGGRL